MILRVCVAIIISWCKFGSPELKNPYLAFELLTSALAVNFEKLLGTLPSLGWLQVTHGSAVPNPSGNGVADFVLTSVAR